MRQAELTAAGVLPGKSVGLTRLLSEDQTMDWSRQSLLFTCGAEIRAAAQMVAAALGVALEEKRHDQFGISFHARDAGGEAISVMETARLRVFSSYRPASGQPGFEASVPQEPTIVSVHSTGRADAIVRALTSASLNLTIREPYPPADVQEADAAWRRLLPELRSQGWEFKMAGYAAPIQLEGRVPSGDPFYYRCRWDTCSLGIGGDDPADIPEWTGEHTVDGEYTASYLHPDDAVRILLALHLDWLRDVGSG